MAKDNISWWLDAIEYKELVLPEFQREFTWSKDQIKTLVDSMLKKYPTGALLFWKTKDVPALKNMPDFAPDHRVLILLDGQQRLTSLYMLMKDAIPPYYKPADITNDPRNLCYNLLTREFLYYTQQLMQGRPEWVLVKDCLCANGNVSPMQIAQALAKAECKEGAEPDTAKTIELFQRVDANHKALLAIKSIAVPVMYVEDGTSLKDALTVFDRVNSQGTPLTEADIALAHMCSNWPEIRRRFKEKRAELKKHGFDFELTFYIRAMNAVVNCRAEYSLLHGLKEAELEEGWAKLNKILDFLVNFLCGTALIYSSDDLNTSNVLIPIIGYLGKHDCMMPDEMVKRRLLYWCYAALIHQRFSSQVDQNLELDLNAISDDDTGASLVNGLEEAEGVLDVTSDSLSGRTVSHPLYSMMCILIRANRGVDWINGLDLSKPYGKSYSPNRHHVFPHSQLTKIGYKVGTNLSHRRLVNEIANRVTLTRAGNMSLFDKPPEEYFPEVEKKNPGNLAKFMIPCDPDLWKLENYRDFLQARRQMIADQINSFMRGLREPPASTARPDFDALLSQESGTVEYKSTLRFHIHKRSTDPAIERAALKTICAFMNTKGGTLLIGVNDAAEVVGLAPDYDSGLKNRDKWELHLTNLVKDQIGASHMSYVEVEFNEKDGKDVAIIFVKKASKPAYLKKGQEDLFFVRTGNNTTQLGASQIAQWVSDYF